MKLPIRGSLIVGTTLIASSAAMFARDATVAYRFGRNELVDSLLLALIPINQLSLIVGPLLMPMLVPFFLRGTPLQQRQFIRRALLVTTAAATGIAALVYVWSPAILAHLGSRLSPAAVASAVSQLRLLSVAIILSAASNVSWAALVARERLILPNLGASVPSLCAVVLLLAGPPSLGIWAVSLGVLIGSVLMCVAGFLAVQRLYGQIEASAHHVREQQAASDPLPGYLGVLKLCGLAGGTSAASILGNFAEQGFAMRVGSGSVSAINYANRVPTFLYGLGTAITASVLLPRFARRAATRQLSARREFRQAAVIAFAITAVFSLAVFSLSTPLVQLIFGRGQFHAADADLVGAVQRVYVLSLPFWVAGMVGARILQAHAANRVILWITVVQYLIDFVVCWAASPRLGASGIALGYLSMSVAYLCMVTGAVWVLGPRWTKL